MCSDEKLRTIPTVRSSAIMCGSHGGHVTINAL